MFVMTISPISNMEEYWREEDDGLSPAHSFRIKTGLSNGNGKSALKWFICLQIEDRPVAVSPLMHECGGAGIVRRRGGGGRRWCRGQDQS